MNEIHRYTLTITFDLWQPFDKAAWKEYDELVAKLRNKELLGHAGNVKSNLTEITDGKATER